MPGHENDRLELIERHDPDSRRDRLELVREIVAMTNAGGGQIHIGISDDGQRPGLSPPVVKGLDPADLQSFADSFVRPDHVQIERHIEDAEAGQVVVITVAPGRHPPPGLY